MCDVSRKTQKKNLHLFFFFVWFYFTLKIKDLKKTKLFQSDQ